MGTSVGQINLDLGVNQSKFKSQMANVTSAAKKAGKALAAAFAIKEIINFSKSCLELGSDLAEVQNVVDVTFGNMSAKVNEFAKNAMTSHGLSEKVAKEYMGQLGAMSKAFGNTTEAAYDQAEALTKLSGDVASFYNLSTDEAFTKLKAVYTGETEALKSLGVVMTQTALDEFALQKGIGKTTAEMSEQEKVSLRLAFVQDRLADASGDFARTADGWANQTRVLSLRFDALKASIGQGLINVLTPVVRLLNALLVRLQATADAFTNFMSALFGKSGNAASSAPAVAATSSEVMADNFDTAAGSAKAIKKALSGFDEINLLDTGSSSSDSSSGGGDAAGVAVPNFDGLAEAVSETKSMDISFLDPVINAFKSFAKDIAPFIDTLKGVFSWLYNEVLLPLGSWAATSLLPAVLNALGGAFRFINSVLVALQPMAEWLWNNFLQPIAAWTGGIIVSVLNGIGNGLRAISNWIMENQTAVQVCTGVILAFVGAWKVTELLGWLGMVGGVSGALKLWTSDLWANLAAKVANKAEDIAIMALYAKDYVVSIGATIASIVKSTTAWIANTAAKVASTAASWAQIAATTAWNAICVAATAVTTAFGVALQFLTSPIGLVIAAIAALVAGFVLLWNKCEGFRNFFIGMWEGIKSAICGIINGILRGIEGFINAIITGVNLLIKALNLISFKTPDWIPIIGGKRFGFNLKEISKVSLPRLATGGYVEANSPQLAIIGDNKREGEIVAPESKIAEAVAIGMNAALAKIAQFMGGGQSKQPIYLTVKLGEDDFWSGFVDYHNDVVKRTGDSPLMI